MLDCKIVWDQTPVTLLHSLLWVYIYIYMPPYQGLSTPAKELTAATHVMQSSSNELSILVSVKAKCKQMKTTTWCLIIPELM